MSPLVRSSKAINTLRIEFENNFYVLTIKPVEKNKLKLHVRNYIEWGEKQVTRKRQKTAAGIPWPVTESVKNRKYWYSIPPKNLTCTKLFMQYVANDRFYCPFAEDPIVSDRCFHRIFSKNEEYLQSLIVILNSTVQAFLVMLLGRSNLGQGALKFEAKDANNLLALDPALLSQQTVTRIINNFSQHMPSSIFKECGINPESKVPISEQEPKPLPDRKELDDIVFDALDLTAEERKEVYRAVCQLVWNRISKAKSVKKRK